MTCACVQQLHGPFAVRPFEDERQWMVVGGVDGCRRQLVVPTVSVSGRVKWITRVQIITARCAAGPVYHQKLPTEIPRSGLTFGKIMLPGDKQGEKPFLLSMMPLFALCISVV